METDYRLVIIVAIMILLDIVFGLAGGIKRREVESGKLREGLWHKSGFIGLIAFSYVLEYASQIADIGYTVPAVSAVCVYVIVTEAVSIVENLCILNPEIAKSPIGTIFKHDEKVILALEELKETEATQ